MNEEATGINEDGKFPAGFPVYDYYRFKAAPEVTLTVEVVPDEPLTPAEVKLLALRKLAATGLTLIQVDELLEDLPDDLPTMGEE